MRWTCLISKVVPSCSIPPAGSEGFLARLSSFVMTDKREASIACGINSKKCFNPRPTVLFFLGSSISKVGGFLSLHATKFSHQALIFLPLPVTHSYLIMAHVNPFLSSNFFPLTSGTHKPRWGISQEGVVGQQQLAEQVKAVHIKSPEKGWRVGIGYLIFFPPLHTHCKRMG